MTKEQLALKIAIQISKGRDKVECFHAVQCIKNYFLDLEIQDLVAIASQYGVSVEMSIY